MNQMKFKRCLLGLLALYLIISIWMSIYSQLFLNNVIYNDYFAGDATMLLSILSSVAIPYSITLPEIILFFKSLIVVILPVVGGILLFKERTFRNGIYFLISSYLFFIETVDISNTSTGIYNVFRKIHVSSYLGIIDMPWLLYYLSVLILVVVIILLIVHELYKFKKGTNY